MKDYDRYIFWLDYFDSEVKRSEGRRVPLNSATKAPTLPELGEACRRLNLQPEPQAARYPSRSERESGYVSIKKSGRKKDLFLRVAKELSTVRGMAQKAQGQRRR